MRAIFLGMAALSFANVPVRLDMLEAPGEVMAFLDACRSVLWLGMFLLGGRHGKQ